MRLRRAVILTNGKAYAENQCIGLLDAINLNLDVSVKVVASSPLTLRWWLQPVPCGLRVLLLRRAGLPLASRGICDEIVSAIKNEKEAGATLIVASGLEAITTAVQVKSELSKSVFVVILGNPQCDCSLFDLVIMPAHELIGEPEECTRDNVMVTQGLVNRATYVALSRARAQSQAQLGALMHPVLVVCFGGPTSLCPFDARTAAKEVRSVCKFAIEKGLVGHVVITYLNRTPEMAKAEFSNLRWLDVWTGDFLPLLAWADIVAVTADSITSCNEVGSSGKPLFTIREDMCRGKVAAFFTYLEACGIAKPFARDSMAKWASGWSYPPLTTTMDTADRVANDLSQANPNGTKMWYRR